MTLRNTSVLETAILETTIKDAPRKMEPPAPKPLIWLEAPKELSPEEARRYRSLAEYVSYNLHSKYSERVVCECAPLGVYDPTEVAAFLDVEMGKWGWRSLTSEWNIHAGRMLTPSAKNRRNGVVLEGPYTKQLPLSVLETMARFKRRVQSDQKERIVYFFIADERTEEDDDPGPQVDPFLMVMVQKENKNWPNYHYPDDFDHFIVDRWD